MTRQGFFSYVLVENLHNGEVSVATYSHSLKKLMVAGKAAALSDYWAVKELAKVQEPREHVRMGETA